MEKIFKVLKPIVWIIILSFILRFYHLSSLPSGFDGDEAAFGYYGYSLLQNLSDEYGHKLPLYFPSIGDYKYPVYAYLTSFPVLVFGLNEFSARFISALAGSLLCVFIYLLIIELTTNKKIAFYSSFLAAISPYSILFSRGAYESNLATTLLVIGFWLLVRYLNKPSGKKIYLSLIPFFLAVFCYSSTRVFLLLFIPALLIIYKKHFKTLRILFGILAGFIIIAFLNPKSLVRANDIGFLKDESARIGIETSIREDGYVWNGKNLLLTRMFHNKVVGFSLSFTKRYFEHLNPSYLFLYGNPNMPKYVIPDVGLLYFFEAITVLLGIVYLGKLKSPVNTFISLWLILSIVPSSLTIETPNPIRALIGLPALIIISGMGIFSLLEIFKKRKYLKILFCFIVFMNFIYFWHQYSLHKKIHEPWFTDGGVKEMVLAVRELEGNYEKVVISKDPYIFFLFFNKVKPNEFIANSDIMVEGLGVWERVNTFGKIIFKMPTNCPKIGRLNVLYVCRGGDIPINAKLLKTIRYDDKLPAFNLIEFVPLSQAPKDVLPEGVHRMVESDSSYPEGLLSEGGGRYW